MVSGLPAAVRDNQTPGIPRGCCEPPLKLRKCLLTVFMPIYEYKCEDCGTKFEKLVRRTSETAGLNCPSCGHNHLKQELSTFSAHASNSPARASEGPVCPGGMCSNPGFCGRN